VAIGGCIARQAWGQSAEFRRGTSMKKKAAPDIKNGSSTANIGTMTASLANIQ